MTRLICRRAPLALAIFLLGCGKQARDPRVADLVPVSGIVTIDGKPVSNASVGFIPQATTRGTGSSGITNKDGKYELTDRNIGPGAMIGEYKVVINKWVLPDGSDFVPTPNMDPMSNPAKEFLPPQYSDPDRTTLTATVPAGAAVTRDFSLKSKP